MLSTHNLEKEITICHCIYTIYQSYHDHIKSQVQLTDLSVSICRRLQWHCAFTLCIPLCPNLSYVSNVPSLWLFLSFSFIGDLHQSLNPQTTKSLWTQHHSESICPCFCFWRTYDVKTLLQLFSFLQKKQKNIITLKALHIM